MKNKLFMYLFLFAVLFIIYQYMNQKSIFESQDTKIENLEVKLQKENDSIESLSNQVMNLNYFTLQGNENAMTYLESLGFEAATVEATVSDAIYEYNFEKGNNPLVPFDGMNGDMKINKLKFLNHKWIQADFTDGKYWGEMILEYSFNEKKELVLTTIASFLYPN
ncbi:MAG: hydrolase [Aequorivita sp.]|nr:hydrolase [Aequorivita sp.]